MSARRRRQTSDQDSSAGTSKEDENLVENWSLTFTEYATQNNYIDLDVNRDGRVDGEQNKGTKKVPDGAGTRASVKRTSHVRPTDETTGNRDLVCRGIIGTSSRQSGLVVGGGGGERSKKAQQADAGSPNVGKENNSSHKDNEPANTESESRQTVNNNLDNDKHEHESDNMKSVSGNRPEVLGKQGVMTDTPHANIVLPDINNKAGESTGSSESAPVLAPPHEVTNTLSVGLGSGNKPPRNSPTPYVESSRVQPIYVRLPGQRQGQMVFAEMNHQAGKIHIVSRDKEKEMLARLSWLLIDAGTSALKATFDSIHPPVSLREHLTQSHVKTVLQRLLQQNVLTDKQWRLLYPEKKQSSTSQRFDSKTLVVLLETICHLCPPYPHGWSQQPLSKDGSLSADIVRLQLLFVDIARHESVAGEHYSKMFNQIRDVIIRLGGPPIKIKMARIETEMINLDLQQHYIQSIRDTWQPGALKRLEKILEPRTKTSRSKKAYAGLKGHEEGLSPEDRVTLKKTYKLLLDNVLAEDVLDRLQQSQVIKFSERQHILSFSKKSERMQYLLDKIMESKLPYALKALFDAMKFKYKKIYDHVMAVRKQTYKEGVVTSVDVEGITQETLSSTYKAAFSRVCPFPWTDTISANIRDIFTPLDIVDNDGRKLHSSELLPVQTFHDRGQRILLEGASGSGKSFLCAWLAYMWATQRHYFKTRYQQLIYLNMHDLDGNTETSIFQNLFGDNPKVSINDFWKMISTNARDVLIIIDGFDQCRNIDLSDILTGRRFAESTVLLTANPNKKIDFIPDTKWFNTGFSEVNIKRCFKTCVHLSQEEPERFDKLFHLAGRESWQLRKHLVNPMLAIQAFATFNILRKGTMLKEMRTTCDLLDKYGMAMATLYCRKSKIDIIGFEFPDEVLTIIDQLDRFAFKCRMEQRVQFTEKQVIAATDNPAVLKFGAFLRFNQKSKLKFASEISLDFLTSRHIADMVYEDIENEVLKNKMIKLPSCMQMMSFLCGQYRLDNDTFILQNLFDHLASRNDYCVRGNFQPAPSIASVTGGEDEGKVKVPRGVLEDFSTSLQCLSECPDRDDMAEVITQSLPDRLIVKMDGMLPLKTVQGLSSCLLKEHCAVTEMELELHQIHHFQLPVFLELASATARSRHIHSIKITWSSLDIMAKFLAAVVEVNKSIDTVMLIEDSSRRPVKQVTAATWAALQSACNNMTAVERFSFLDGRHTAIVNNVLQHLAPSIACINLTGCVMNQMCAGQISCLLHGSAAIRQIDLSYTSLNSTEFVAIFQGMQMCEGMKHIRIRGARLDRPCVVALTEYIRLTNSLEVLDLSDCELTTDMCNRLVSAIKQNRTIERLVFKNAKITIEGRQVIATTKTKLQPVFVEGLVPLY